MSEVKIETHIKKRYVFFLYGSEKQRGGKNKVLDGVSAGEKEKANGGGYAENSNTIIKKQILRV